MYRGFSKGFDCKEGMAHVDGSGVVTVALLIGLTHVAEKEEYSSRLGGGKTALLAAVALPPESP